MKIAFVSYAYSNRRMLGKDKLWMYGMGRYATKIVETLSKMGFNVDVFSPKIYVKNVGPLAFTLENSLKNFDSYDIVHSNEASGVFVNHKNKIETFHHLSLQLGLKYRFFSSIQIMAIRNAKHIIVPSYASKKSIMNLDKKIPDDKITVIYHGLDKQVFNSSNANKKLAEQFRIRHSLTDHFVVINVGRLEKHKRQRDIINAMADLKKSALILVGRGNEKKSLIDFAKKKGVQLLYFDYVPDAKLVVLYNASDVYVHTSILEGFGLTVLEAMACGLPIIAYKVADFDQIVKDAGYLMDIGDVNGIRSTLLILRRDHDIRDKMSSAAVSYSKDFTWSKCARKHLDVYRRILDV